MLLWTREQEDSQLFKGFPFPVLHRPCIKTRPIPISPSTLEAARSCKLAFFTSPQAASLCVNNPTLLALLKSMPQVFAVGEGTADPLTQKGILVQTPLHGRKGGGHELVLFLKQQNLQRQRSFLPGAKERAFDLENALQERGCSTVRADVYETQSGLWIPDREPPQTIQEFWGNPPPPKKWIVAFCSPSAVKGFQHSFIKLHLPPPQTWLCLGKTTETALRERFPDVLLTRCMRPQAPSLAELIALAQQELECETVC